jgi:hypothetical protein
MPILLLKLVVTPLLIGGASLAARRWGPAVGGWLVAFPLTAGPVTFFIAIELGVTFAAAVAEGALAADIALAAYALAYGWSAAGGARWPAALMVGSVAYAGLVVVLQPLLVVSAGLLLAVVFVVLWATLRFLPDAATGSAAVDLPWWDIPLRAVLGTAIVLLLTAVAPALGPHLSGLAATFPVYASILAVFTQHREGARQAIGVQRGLIAGLFGTAVFWAVVAVTLPQGGIAVAFGGAIVAVLIVQGVALRWLRTADRS